LSGNVCTLGVAKGRAGPKHHLIHPLMHNLHNEFILPSPALRQVINHYEVFKLKGAMTNGGVQLFPSLTVGLLFIFSAAKPIGVLSSCFEEE
jgi:hypothetical protein